MYRRGSWELYKCRDVIALAIQRSENGVLPASLETLLDASMLDRLYLAFRVQ